MHLQKWNFCPRRVETNSIRRLFAPLPPHSVSCHYQAITTSAAGFHVYFLVVLTLLSNQYAQSLAHSTQRSLLDFLLQTGARLNWPLFWLLIPGLLFFCEGLCGSLALSQTRHWALTILNLMPGVRTLEQLKIRNNLLLHEKECNRLLILSRSPWDIWPESHRLQSVSLVTKVLKSLSSFHGSLTGNLPHSRQRLYPNLCILLLVLPQEASARTFQVC